MTTTVLNPALGNARARPESSLLQRVWAALEAHGQRRAAAELNRIAALHVSTDPELARNLRALAQRSDRG